MPGYDHLYGSTQTSGGTGTSSGAVGGYTPPPPTTTTTTGSTNNNQVSPGHPGGGYDPNQNQPPPPVNTTPIIDDTLDDSWESQVNPWGDDYVEPYTSPEEVYSSSFGGEGTDWVNVSQIGGSPNNPGSLLYDIDPRILGQWGIDSKSEFIPQDLIQMMLEGTFLSGNEAAANAALAPDVINFQDENFSQDAYDRAIESGWQPFTTTWSQFEDMTQMADAGNKNAQEWLRTHTHFPGGYHDYYDTMDQDWGITSQGGGGGWTPERNLLDERRAWQEQMWYGPRQSPQKDIQQQGFFDTMEDAYSKDIAETLDKGLYSKAFIHPKAGMPWGMEKIWATGRAKGGIVSLVGG